jgi:(p)ppGpp synthase/HD superfamily hydrolase
MGIIYMSTVLHIAEGIAREAHASQTEESTGDPYIRHIERVVSLVGDCDNLRAVAWLHDVIEDSQLNAGDLLNRGVSTEIVGAVVELTRVPAFETYAAYIQRVKESGNHLAIAVKIADLRDHLRPNCPERLRPRYEKAMETLDSCI